MECVKCNELTEELNTLRRMSKKLDIVLDSSYDGIFITDGSGIIIRVNHAYERITGMRADHLINKPVTYLVDEGIISRSCSTLVLANHKVTTIQQKLSSGKILLVTGTPIFNEEGDIDMVITNVRDMTELFVLKEEIQAKEKEKDFYSIELAKLRKQLYAKDELVTKHQGMQQLYDRAKQLSKHGAPVLLMGELGVGKKTYVQLLHKLRDDPNMTLLTWHCNSIPIWENMADKIEALKEQHDETILLFLDGIENLAINHQEELLEWFSKSSANSSVRIVSSTKLSMEALASSAYFREDLLYQIGVVPIELLALRDRPVDLLPLIHHYVDKLNNRYSTSKQFSKEVMEAFSTYQWPGNIRELKNVIERMYTLSKNDQITIDVLPEEISEKVFNKEKISLKEEIMKVEYKYIQEAMNKYGNVRDAAKYLGIDASTLVRKRQKYIDISSNL